MFLKKIGFAVPVFKKSWSDLKCFKKMIGSKVFKKRWSDLKCFKKMVGSKVFKKR